jgi:hypothetical protein
MVVIREQNSLFHPKKKISLWLVAGVSQATGSGGSPLNCFALRAGRAAARTKQSNFSFPQAPSNTLSSHSPKRLPLSQNHAKASPAQKSAICWHFMATR